MSRTNKNKHTYIHAEHSKNLDINAKRPTKFRCKSKFCSKFENSKANERLYACVSVSSLATDMPQRAATTQHYPQAYITANGRVNCQLLKSRADELQRMRRWARRVNGHYKAERWNVRQMRLQMERRAPQRICQNDCLSCVVCRLTWFSASVVRVRCGLVRP